MKRELLRLLQKVLSGELRRAKRRKSSSPLLILGLAVAVLIVTQFLYEPDAPLPAEGTELHCSVSKVYDGDTVTASCEEGRLKVRVFGIDAPEIGQQPWGKQSRELLESILPSQVRMQVVDTDRYGRVVARLYDGDRDLGLGMVRQGGAVVYEQYNKYKIYRTAQAEAKEERLGIWSRPGAQQNPSGWRKLNPN